MNESLPLVTFIITTYNLPDEYLRTCIKHVLHLTLTPKEREVIVVDDGSALSCVEELDEYMDDIIYIRQANQGLSVARNTGLRMARGKYVQFVDGDDYLVRTPYDHCLDIVRYHQPDMVVFDHTRQPQAETPLGFTGPMTGSSYMRNHNIKGSACSYIFRRAVLGSLRFTPGTVIEDEEFTAQLILRAETLYITEAKAYYYRQREGSLVNDTSAEHSDRRLADTLAVIYRLQEKADRMPENEKVALRRRVAQLSMDYLYNTIRLSHSYTRLMEAINQLRNRNLFPLPDKQYTRKYTYFRRMTQSAIGRRILVWTIR